MMSRISLVTRARRSVAIASRRRRERYHRTLRRPHSRRMIPLLLAPVRTRVIIGIISVCRRRRRIETAMDIVMVGEGGGVAQRAAATAVAVGGSTAMIAAAQAVAAAITVAAASVCADRQQAPHRSVERRCHLPSRAAGCAPETVGKGLAARRWFERRSRAVVSSSLRALTWTARGVVGPSRLHLRDGTVDRRRRLRRLLRRQTRVEVATGLCVSRSSNNTNPNSSSASQSSRPSLVRLRTRCSHSAGIQKEQRRRRRLMPLVVASAHGVRRGSSSSNRRNRR